MTNVYLSYNPFTVKTEILINNEPVKSTSTLYRYRNTPMQDWVGAFIPELVEHCNDDQIEIIFHGLQFNFDDLEGQVKLYTEKNRDIELTLNDDICKSQVARIGTLSAIIDEIENQDLVSQLKNDDVSKRIAESFAAKLEVIVISGNDKLKSDLINRLIGTDVVNEGSERGLRIIDNDKLNEITTTSTEEDFDVVECNISFTNSKYAALHIIDTPNSETQDDCYYRYIKKAISTASKPIVIFILDSNTTYNNEEFLSLISEQFRYKGKQNKERFVFVAENTVSAKKYLYSDYSIKNEQLFNIDDIAEIQAVIDKYMKEYCLIDKIKLSAEVMTSTFKTLMINLEDSVSKNKSTQSLDELLYQIKQELSKSRCKCSCDLNDDMVNSKVQAFIDEVTNEFSTLFNKASSNSSDNSRIISPLSFFKSSSSSLTVDEAKQEVKEYINVKLKSKIHAFLSDTIGRINNQSKNTILYTEDLLSLFQHEDLQEIISPYINSNLSSITNNRNNSGNVQKTIDAAISEIANIEIKKQIGLFTVGVMYAAYITSSKPKEVTENVDGSKTITYRFYDGLSVLLPREVSSDTSYSSMPNYINLNAKQNCTKMFKESIKMIVPVLENVIKSSIRVATEDASFMETVKNNNISEITQKVTEKIYLLKEQAKISEDDQKRLDYLEELSKKLISVVQI